MPASPSRLLLAACLALAAAFSPALAQRPTVVLTVRVRTDTAALPEVLVQTATVVRITDARGVARLPLAAAVHRVVVAKLGFVPESLTIDLSAGRDSTVAVRLSPRAARLGRTIVSSTRTERALADEPLRVEVVSGDEVIEKMQQRPSDLRGVLSEMSGVRVQTSGSGLGPTYARIEGMPGRYTLFLTDGLPIWGAGSEGFELLQITPIDVAQVEAITGPASALYGPAALGGVIDLVSRRPPAMGEAREVLVSQSSREGSDAAVWDGRKLGDRWGASLLGGIHYQTRNDLDGDGWADIARTRRGEVRPRLYWTGEDGSTLYATGSFMSDDRAGGDEARWPMELRTRRADAGAVARLRVSPRDLVTVRVAGEREWRRRMLDTLGERERRETELAELSWSFDGSTHAPLVGVALQHDALRALDVVGFDYDRVVPGVFAQDTWTPSPRWTLALAVRTDANTGAGAVTSPRASLLVHLGGDWSVRGSAAGGYFAPTPLTEETEETGLRYVVPLTGVSVERAQYAAIDVAGTVSVLRLSGSVFASRIVKPMSLRIDSASAPGSPPLIQLVNAGEPLRVQGAELLVGWQPLDAVSVTGTYTRVKATQLDLDRGTRGPVPLTPGHTAELDLVWSSADAARRLSLELYRVGVQSLRFDPYRTTSRPYSTATVLAEQRLGGAILFANLENLTGVRQTRWESLLLPTPGPGGRRTSDVWAPLEGRLFNAGVRVAF